jgi:DNA-binding response OmpR family regulator
MQSHGKILIADDESSFARPLAELFRLEGFDSACAPDATAALQLLQHEPFDLLISDINMPGNTGLELLSQLAPESQGMPVILLTGRPTVETAVKSIGLSVVAYLIKPPDFDELLHTARQAISNYRALRAARSSRDSLERWCRELELLEQGLRKSPGAPGSQSVADFVSLTVGNLMNSLIEFQRMAHLLSTVERSKDSVEQATVLHTLGRAVDVLERTRRNFKSTELRDLRVELEALLKAVQERRGLASG